MRNNSRIKNFLRSAVLSGGATALGAILPSCGQHNVHIKTSSLAQGTPISDGSAKT